MHGKVIPFPARPSRLSLWLDWFVTDARVLWAIWALFVVLRFIALTGPMVPTGAAREAVIHAAGLASGAGYLDAAGRPTALGAPGWPIALSWMFAQFGVTWTALGLLNMAAAILSALFCHALTRRMFAARTPDAAPVSGEGPARFALLVLALCPAAIVQVTAADGTVLEAALILAGCWTLVARTSRWHLIGSGLIFGFATMVDPVALAVLPVVFAIDALRRGMRAVPGLLKDLAITLALVALTLSPWALRGYLQLDHWTIVGTGGGTALLEGNAPLVKYPGTTADNARAALAAARPGQDAARRDGLAAHTALDAITHHPAAFAALAPAKLAALWWAQDPRLLEHTARSRILATWPALGQSVMALGRMFDALLLIGMGIGLVAIPWLRRRGPVRGAGWWLLPYGTSLAYSGVAVVFSGDPATRGQILPWLCMVSGWLIFVALRRLAARPRRIPVR